jgi:hypothetical protein
MRGVTTFLKPGEQAEEQVAGGNQAEKNWPGNSQQKVIGVPQTPDPVRRIHGRNDATVLLRPLLPWY